MFLKLSDPSGMFVDSETGLRIVRDEIKEVSNIGAFTRQWLNGGGLVMCDPQPNMGEAPVISTPEDVPDQTQNSSEEDDDVTAKAGRPEVDPVVSVDIAEDAKNLIAQNSIDTLKQMAKERGIKFTKTISASTLAKNIVKFDREHQQ